MSSLQTLYQTRLKKLKEIQKKGFNPYPLKCSRTHTCLEVIQNFKKLTQTKKEITLAGRLISIREHGGSTFAHLEDGTAKFQLYFKRDILGPEKYQFFLDNFDLGDFLESQGSLFITKKGEKTLEVKNFKILAKALRPLPEKWYGLKDIEERFRKRYLDLLINKEVKERFIKRALIIKAIREFLEKRGFIEVETPVLQTIPGGALARPFKTHLNALNLDLYLRIAPELYLKRLLVGGLEKIYELGRCFRNEGMDREHNPEFTLLEFYWAYADYEDLMNLTEEMLQELIKKIKGKKDLKIVYQGKKIDFQRPWIRKEFNQLLKEQTQIDPEKDPIQKIKKKIKELKLETNLNQSRAKLLDELYKKYCRPKIIQPTFILHHPLEMSPLAKRLEKDSQKAARFQLIIAGLEIVNAYSELNNPLDQKERFEEQEKNRKLGDEEAQRYDQDFIEALEYGLPPAAGFGMGIDRLVALLTNAPNLREVILFPLMRPKK